MADRRSPLNYVGWYLRRPAMWGELVRGAAARLRGHGPNERSTATRRCDDIAVSRVEAARRLGVELIDVTQLSVYQRARALLVERGVQVAGAGDTAMLYSVCLGTAPGTVAETGVAHGLSSLALLMALDSTGSGRLVSVDMPYRGSSDDAYVGQAVPVDLRQRWTLYREPDRRGVPRAIRTHAPFDLVHYDSDKTRRGREFAYPKLWNALRPGGWFLSDDVGDDLAFLEFAQQLSVEPIVWQKVGGGDFVGALHKPAQGSEG